VPDAAEAAAARPLAWARIAFAAVLIIRTTPLVRIIDPNIGAEVNPLLGWPQSDQFRAALFDFALPIGAVKILCIVRTISAVVFLLGYRPMASGIVIGVTGYAVVLQDVFGFTFTQHLLFVGAIALGLTDCAAVLSIRPERPKALRTSRYLIWTLVTSVYFWAACSKIRRDWFDGRTLELFRQDGKIRGHVADILLGTATRRSVAGTAVVLVEFALIPLLWMPRTRWLGLALALALHVSIEQVARPDVLGWAMIALLLSFVPAPRSAIG